MPRYVRGLYCRVNTLPLMHSKNSNFPMCPYLLCTINTIPIVPTYEKTGTYTLPSFLSLTKETTFIHTQILLTYLLNSINIPGHSFNNLPATKHHLNLLIIGHHSCISAFLPHRQQLFLSHAHKTCKTYITCMHPCYDLLAIHQTFISHIN